MNTESNFIKFDNDKIETASGTGRVSTLTFDSEFTVVPVKSKSPNAPTHHLLGKSPAGYAIQIGV